MKQFISRIKDNFYNRFTYLILFLVVVAIFSVFTKRSSYDKNYGEEGKLLLQGETLTQDISLLNNNIRSLEFKASNNNPIEGAIFKISIYSEGTLLASQDINTKNISGEQNILFDLNNQQINNKIITIEISGNAINIQDGLYIHTVNNNADNINLNGTITNKSIGYTIGYSQYTYIYNLSLVLILVAGFLFILLLDINRIHNYTFAAILFVGVFLCMFNPILDTPDDHAHLCRAEFTSRGILFLNGNQDEYNISNSVSSIINDNYKTFSKSNIVNESMDFNYESAYANYANTNSFLGYIPQALGIIVAKIFGKLFGLSTVIIIIFGRMFNLFFYAAISRFAIKKSPIFKVPLSIAALSPMALFIASSFNPDTTTYALVLLLISYILYLYKRGNINIKDLIFYSILCVLIGIVKLPYSIMGGLILFLPSSKFESKMIYYKSFLFVLLIAIISVSWGGFAILSSSGDSPFNSFYTQNNIDTKKQILSILKSPLRFAANFSLALVSNFKAYIEQMGTFGWLSYSLNPGILMIYPIIIGSMIIFYPNEEIISTKTKAGVSIVAFGIYAFTCLILYLTWTPVGNSGINGVQGRYFVPLIGLLMLLSNGKSDINKKQKIDYQFMNFAMLFSVVLLLTMMNRYY